MQESDEIDLLKLLEQVWRFIFKNKLIFILAIVLGAMGGYGSFRWSKKIYQSKMLFHSDIITPLIGTALLDELNALVGVGNWGKLGEVLHLSAEQVSGIVNITIRSPLDHSEPMIIKETERRLLIIELKSTAPALFSIYEKSIISYLENNDYSKSREKLKKNLYEGVHSKVVDEITDLEKLKKEVNDTPAGAEKYKNLLGLSEINSTIATLVKLKFSYQDSLSQLNRIVEINGFTTIYAPNPYKSIAIGIAIGLLLSLSFVWIRNSSV